MILGAFSDHRVILKVKIGFLAFLQLLTLNSSKMLQSASFLIPSKPARPLGHCYLEECPKKVIFKHKMVTSTVWTLQPENEGYPKNRPVEKRYPT